VKLSVSLPDDDVAFLDAWVADERAASRSAALHEALRLLRRADLEAEYAEAFTEWADSGEGEVWAAAVGDGVD
jgi:Arc/MetJ-type ribon-helix-helix transcriptional regulator